MNIKQSLTILLLHCTILLNAQQPINEYFADAVKSVKFTKADNDFSYPICMLEEALTLKFDIINDIYDELNYEIIHCDSEFIPDDLIFSEYAEGFQGRMLDNYQSSFNTHRKYTHYELTIPNNDIKLTISGNYIIKIFADNDPDNLVLVKRFMISQNVKNITINAGAEKPFLPEYMHNYQQINVVLDNTKSKIANPNRFIKIYVMQNYDFNTRKQLDISHISNTEIKYTKNDGNNIFLAGNEYLWFEIKDIKFKSLYVDDIKYNGYGYNCTLTYHQPQDATYSYHEDLNGDFYIKNDRGFNNDLEADYINVLFRLKYDRFYDKNIYLYGSLTNYQTDERYKLKYNNQSGFYECSLLLKQGLYNYQYVGIDNQNNIDQYIDGSFYNTENNYLITVYSYDYSKRGQRLETYKIINTQN